MQSVAPNERTAKRRPRRVVRITGIGLAIVVGLLGLLALIGYLLPSEVAFVDTGLTLEASSTELFPIFDSRVGQQRMWRQAWQRSGGELPPMVIVDLGGPSAGVGCRIGFFPDGKRLGSIVGALSTVARGRGVIVESVPDRRVVIDIDFGFVASHRVIELEALDRDTTRVRWSETLRMTNPLMRYASLLLDASVADGFDEVLRAAEEVVTADRER